jgi:restriction system protein
MSIPKYHELMLPMLNELASGSEKTISDLKKKLAKDFKLTEEELKELLPSGNQLIFDNRVGWARTYLKKAMLIESTKRGVFKITERGMKVLKEGVTSITATYLKKFDEFRAFQSLEKPTDYVRDESLVSDSESTPIEIFEKSYKKIQSDLKNEILDQIFSCSPFFFEKLVVDLVINLGYGGSRKEAGEAFRTTSDEGIDGIIKEDKLGLDLIYLQAKRWKKDSCVGRPEVQKFAGALQGKRAKKGIFITTSYFSNDAREYVSNIDSKIILIDSDELCSLMIESNTGVSILSNYSIKKIDSDYFSEE